MSDNRWGRLLLVLALLSPASQAAVESPVRSISVTSVGAVYVCDAVMFAPVPPAVAWEVLIDFEHMAEWVPNVRTSRVLKRESDSATIEQRGTARFGVANFAYTTERRIEMNKPVAIRSTQIKGSLRRVESLMTLEPDGKGTGLNYHLEVVPGLLARAVMSRSFLEHEIAEQFGAIVAEMTRRAQ